jgi:hypothetical protein
MSTKINVLAHLLTATAEVELDESRDLDQGQQPMSPNAPGSKPVELNLICVLDVMITPEILSNDYLAEQL